MQYDILIDTLQDPDHTESARLAVDTFLQTYAGVMTRNEVTYLLDNRDKTGDNDVSHQLTQFAVIRTRKEAPPLRRLYDCFIEFHTLGANTEGEFDHLLQGLQLPLLDDRIMVRTWKHSFQLGDYRSQI